MFAKPQDLRKYHNRSVNDSRIWQILRLILAVPLVYLFQLALQDDETEG